MQTGVRVLDAMTKMPISVSPFETVANAAQLMEKHGVGSLVVMQGKELVGLVTERDLMIHAISKQTVSLTDKISKCMKTQILSLQPQVDIYDALVTMNQFDIKHAPVVHKNALVGFITLKDIMKIQPDLMEVAARKFDVRERDSKPILQDRQDGVQFYFE